jgi:hypothetical protein
LSTTDDADALHARLEADRRDLLDLTLRNPLLNYAPRARGLELSGATPEGLYRLLVREGRPAGIRAEGQEGEGPVARGLSAEELPERLLKIAHAARTAVEEQGVNTLFLALGMLRWVEGGPPPRELRAPLVLVPVTLARHGAREGFRLRHDGEDPEGNLSLAERLRREFGVEWPELPEPEEVEVPAYFDAVERAVAGRPGWSVDRGAAALGFFSFGKYRMYLDLDPGCWPGGTKPGEHRLMRALLGDGFEAPAGASGEAEPPPVLDADGSQAEALRAVASGADLVIQGPPGTGKSQTIANLIAAAVGRGQAVLFVAEKLAALEVVKRRLDAVGLGDACLELHSHRTGKRSVLEQLRRTLARARLDGPSPGPDPGRLGELAARLDAYCAANNEPVGATGVTPHEAAGEVLRLRAGLAGADPPALEVGGLAEWDAAEFERRSERVARLQARRASLGDLASHPFFGSRASGFGPDDGARVREGAGLVRHAATALRESASALAEALGLEPPTGPVGCGRLVLAARRAAELARLGGCAEAPEWSSRAEDVRLLMLSGATRAELIREHGPALLPHAWEADVLPIRGAINASGRRWWTRLAPSYREARRRLAALCAGEPPRGVAGSLALLDAILEVRRRGAILERLDDLGRALFGPTWRGPDSDWDALAASAGAVARLAEDVAAGRLPAALGRAAGGASPGVLEALAGSVEAALAAHEESARALMGRLRFDEPARFGAGSGLASRPFEEQDALLAAWAERSGELAGLAAFHEVAGRCRAEGLDAVADAAESWPASGARLVEALRLARFEAILRRARAERPALADFDAGAHEATLAAFRDEDRAALVRNRAAIAASHRARVPRHAGGGQLALLRRELAKRARHLPVRQLMARAGEAVQAVAPVFLMSPLSVAAYLPPGLLRFDLAVFDEASQVRPVDAFGALLRSKQAVVVGDSRQLPPTTFFDRLTGGDDVERDEEETSGDVESILGLFGAQGAAERMLRWHYRSRHESLIAVSNREFYDGRLVVFPSPDAGRRDSGLVLRHLPGTTYDRGRTRTNPGEAEAVARAVLAFARAQGARPASRRQSLGVATFSVAQMDAIVSRLERLRVEAPELDGFFAEDAEEPFFIKNLENVQGDERDVIYISIGYGRTADGSVSLNFGPLNGEGGERRLNVLITRARVRCEVFTNLRPEDLDPGRTRARGVQALRAFLEAAAGRDRAGGGAGEAPSAFAAEVARALEAHGLGARLGVGEAGCRLDAAALDPARPGRFALGVVADGPAYREAGAARDRDRLRPEVLERLGWRLRRAWAPEWLEDPAAAARRMLEAAGPAPAEDEGVEPAAEPPAAGPGLDHEPEADADELPEPRPADVPAYVLATLDDLPPGTDLAAADPRRLADWVARVVEVEGPVHGSEVARRLADASGLKRLNAKVHEAIESAVGAAVASGRVVRLGDGEFLDRPGGSAGVLRDRGGLPNGSRRLELVADVEIARAVARAVADAYGLEPAAVAPAACRLLGFPRTSEEMRRRVDAVVAGLVADGRLEPRGEFLQPGREGAGAREVPGRSEGIGAEAPGG